MTARTLLSASEAYAQVYEERDRLLAINAKLLEALEAAVRDADFGSADEAWSKARNQ